MSFELIPIRKSEMSARTVRRELAGELHGLATSCPVTSSRDKHPTVSGFLNKKRVIDAVERLAEATDNPEHPVNAFAVYSIGKYSKVLSGAALVATDVEVLFKKYGNSNRQPIDGKRSVCVAWLGVGGVRELAQVNELLIAQSGRGNEIAIEPQSSDPVVHQALSAVYPNYINGGFVLGHGRVTQFSTAYGLCANDLTHIPRL